MLIFLISSVVAVLPFTIGGLGAREVVSLWGAQIFGLDHTVSVMASLLFYGATVASSLPGLAIYIYRSFKNQFAKNCTSTICYNNGIIRLLTIRYQ